jgi:hypothetical protein
MKDGPEEIASVMNLILPLSEQLPIKEDFLEEYIDESSSTIYPQKINKLKYYLKGRVSFLKSAQTDIKKIFEGRFTGNLRHLKISEDYMSEFQSNAYLNAYKKDETEKGVYAYSRQARINH